MNTELEQTLLELAESQDAINKKLKSLDKKINNLDEKQETLKTYEKYSLNHREELENSKNLLFTITDNHSDSICENIENIEILDERITSIEENLNENIKIFNINNDIHNKNIEEFNEFKESVNNSFTHVTRMVESVNNKLDCTNNFFNNKIEEFNKFKESANKSIIKNTDDIELARQILCEIDLGLKFLYDSNKERVDDINSLKETIGDLQKRITIVAKEGDTVYLLAYGDTTKFKIVSIIGDEVILKFSSWWLPRLLGNDRYINVPKDTIYYKDKKNYIIL